MTETVEWVDEICGIYFRSILLKNAGDVATQHVHDHDHATYIGSGSVEFYAGGRWIGYYRAGQAVAVKAGVEHRFRALERDTRLTCVHIAESAERAKEKELLQAESQAESQEAVCPG